MATFVQTNVRLYIDAYNYSSSVNALALSYGCEAKDGTTYGDTTRENVGGLKTIELGYAGLWDPASTAKNLARWDSIGTNDKPVTVAPTGGAIGERAFFFQSLQSQYTPKFVLGEMAAFDVSAMGRGDLIQGNVIFPLSAITSTSASTAQELGAASATQIVYAAMHITAVSGTSPTLDVVVESDTAVGFPSAATRITFSQKSAIGSDYQTLGPGAITDTWWRISYTIGGTDTPSFSTAVVLGIQ